MGVSVKRVLGFYTLITCFVCLIISIPAENIASPNAAHTQGDQKSTGNLRIKHL